MWKSSLHNKFQWEINCKTESHPESCDTNGVTYHPPDRVVRSLI